MSRLMTLYDRLPLPFQNAACSLEGFRINRTRFGSDFARNLGEYNERRAWSYERICEFRDQRIRSVVKHAYESVPFYNRLLREGGINYSDIRGLDDLKRLPILDKEDVRSNLDDMVSRSFDRRHLVRKHTSGTTGAGLVFYSTKDAECEKWAEAWCANEAIGLERSMRRAYFGGRNIVPASQGSPPFYRFDRCGNQLLMSAFHMNEAGFESFLDGFEKYRPVWIHGFPSSICAFARYLVDNGIRLPREVEFVTLSSENVTEWQESLIHEAFGVLPYQNYAQTEGVATFRERRDHSMYVSEDVAAVEFEPVGDGLCRVIGTTLVNYGMPLLRYDTGDLATWEQDSLGRRIMTLDGRSEDNLLLPDGTVLRRLDFLFKDQTNIEASQIVQTSRDHLKVKIVPGKRFSEEDYRALEDAFNARLVGKIGFDIVRVESIPKTASGKMKFVVSEFDHG